MASATLVGRVIGRKLGDYEHSSLQAALAAWFYDRRNVWKIRVLMAQRIRVAAGRFRVPDLYLLSKDQAAEPVFTHPPLVCIERNPRSAQFRYVSTGMRHLKA
jgi:hypothetical protein